MRGYSAIGLHAPKSPENFGAVLRAAWCYGAALVAVNAPRKGVKREIGKAQDTPKAARHIPVIVGDLRTLIPYDCVPVCVEIAEGACPIADFRHPDRAFYVLGPEDGSVPADVQEWCHRTIYVPTRTCMNLAATANVVLFHRALQRGEWLGAFMPEEGA